MSSTARNLIEKMSGSSGSSGPARRHQPSSSLRGFKEIASHVEHLSGVSFDARSAQRASLATRDPLPCVVLRGRVAASEADVNRWVERQLKRRG